MPVGGFGLLAVAVREAIGRLNTTMIGLFAKASKRARSASFTANDPALLSKTTFPLGSLSPR
jgi:hypothetical protein